MSVVFGVPCLSLRELEKQIGYDLDSQMDPLGKNLTVKELVSRYLATKTGIRPSTKNNYGYVQNLMGHSDIGVTMNTYTHLGLEDAQEEMMRLQETEKARAEMERLNHSGDKVTKAVFRAG